MFAWLEKNPFFFTIAFVIVFSIAGLVQIIPDFRKSSQPLEGLRPLTVLETAGRDVYMKEGCYNCHSQLIREFKSEVMRYGMYSLSGEYAYDRPFLWGSKRTGPDLHRIGDNRSSDWHANHMYEPTSVVQGSIMPAYKHLYTKEVDFETAYAEALTQKKVFNVPYDVEGLKTSVKLGSLEEAKEQFIKDAAEVVEDMKNEPTTKIFDDGKGKITEIVALIAYMNSLGSSRIVK
ncbi:cytochrome-c oxidase, cbb3-type subunit II [Helicobacter sp. MIT 14-3879]|uniref:cytochrome-c oxidase, cbb3-type subunit II n=1 Tax=Helicobacter sp. MIT 14-3879 TaxID=2040649 RepID=UPI000E1EF305|nr:cytochrome-c oxidase, cbb3-type subunit II [Helicobacter sp. MIT 14-3879]RDU61451.1 cytochrome-c oxidase, cbb3-type subunit II [Helicobacter sp. MIT 14-3879]